MYKVWNWKLIFIFCHFTETKYGVKARIVDVDFTLGAEIYDRIAKELEGLEIGVLVNNVGMSYQYPEYLSQVGDATQFILA